MRLVVEYAYIRSLFGDGDNTSVYQHYKYIDIDRIADDSGDGEPPTADPESGDQTARSQGYEKLDQADLVTVHQSQDPQEYVGLAGREASAGTGTDEVEMAVIKYQNIVC